MCITAQNKYHKTTYIVLKFLETELKCYRFSLTILLFLFKNKRKHIISFIPLLGRQFDSSFLSVVLSHIGMFKFQKKIYISILIIQNTDDAIILQ